MLWGWGMTRNAKISVGVVAVFAVVIAALIPFVSRSVTTVRG